MKRLSIIIPMYKVEPYVEKCLRSLEDQDIATEEFEIICVNDGSPDNCHLVVMKLQKEYENIILINQENQGVSSARNNGIEIASGSYLLFIDPDDYVDSNSFKRILDISNEMDAEVTFLGFTFLNEDGTIRRKVFNEGDSKNIYSGPVAYKKARGDGNTDPDRMWGVLYNRDFINRNNLRYLHDVPYLEDGEMIARILCLADRCIFEGGSFYQRTTRPGSATNSKLFNSDRAIYGFILAGCNLKRFQNIKKLTDERIEFMNQPIAKFVLLAIGSSVQLSNPKRLFLTTSQLTAQGFESLKLSGCNKEYRMYGKTYNISPYFSAILLTVIPRIENLIRKLYHVKKQI